MKYDCGSNQKKPYKNNSESFQALQQIIKAFQTGTRAES